MLNSSLYTGALLKDRIAGAPRIDFFKRYQIGKRTEELGYQEVVKEKAASPASPTPAPSTPGDGAAYVVNVATIPTDPSPEEIATKYGEQAFGDPAQAATRLGIVVGVNKYQSLDGSSPGLVQTHAQKLGAHPFHVRGFGFTWSFNWQRTRSALPTDADGFAGAKTAYDEQEPAVKTRAIDYEKQHRTQQYIPYGLIKERVTVGPHTQTLVKELNKYKKYVYIHLGDADAVSLKAAEEQQTVAGPMKDDKDKNVTALFDRYDKIIEAQKQPMMAIGGYEFRLLGETGEPKDKKAKGDLDRSKIGDNLTYLANQLDQAVRIAIASVAPGAVYPTEPNVVFLAAGPGGENMFDLDLFEPGATADEKKLKKPGSLFGVGAREGRKLQKNLIHARERRGLMGPNKNKVVFDPRAAIATGSTRFRLGGADANKEVPGSGGKSTKTTYAPAREEAFTKGIPASALSSGFDAGKEGFKAQVIEDIITQTQSFIDPTDFAREVEESVPLSDKTKTKRFANNVSNKIYTRLLESNKNKYKPGSFESIPTGVTAPVTTASLGGAVPKSPVSLSGGTSVPVPPTPEQQMQAIIRAVTAKLDSPELAWLWSGLTAQIDKLYTEAGHT